MTRKTAETAASVLAEVQELRAALQASREENEGLRAGAATADLMIEALTVETRRLREANDERRLTRAEWEREMRLEQCSRQGHDYEIVTVLGRDRRTAEIHPVCRRCGLLWPVFVVEAGMLEPQPSP